MKKRGFTLVELMIVITVISILASIVMPKMSQTRVKAKLKACEMNMKSITVAANMYMNDTGGLQVRSGTISSSHVLVTRGYLKARPDCPARIGTGNSYVIGGTWPDDYVYCYNTSSLWHVGLPVSRPLYYFKQGYFREN